MRRWSVYLGQRNVPKIECFGTFIAFGHILHKAVQLASYATGRNGNLSLSSFGDDLTYVSSSRIRHKRGGTARPPPGIILDGNLPTISRAGAAALAR